ncbi:sugar ABC transporter ATP-binding protein, partial [Deinococcus sp.]|uniref:sugar ABC transporter ATP-binding protein n=1 Tax=Deinococcus sp. TaxID=47478 RepID=UPI00286E10E9
RVHALIGENGAGKSTLIKVLTGVYPPSSGVLNLDGRPAVFSRPSDAQQAGIRVVHQDRQLIPGFSVLENLYLGAAYPQRRGRIDWNFMRREAAELQSCLNLDLPLDELAQRLTPTQRTLTELLRAVRVRSRLLILDEPTAPLSHSDTQLLFGLIRQLSAEGTAILYVSHRLDEVLHLADEITVLRGGGVAQQFQRGEADAGVLVTAMSGMAADQPATSVNRAQRPMPSPPLLAQLPLTQPPLTQPLLSVQRLGTRDGRVLDVSLTLHRGEVLGIYGLAGSGRTELLEALVKLRVPVRGRVVWASGSSARSVLIPEDRRRQGMIAGMSVQENMTLTTLGAHCRWGRMLPASERRAVQEATQALDIHTSGPAQPISELSGGNQQKVIFARAMAQRPEVWLCDEPTQAVDVMTRQAIHHLLRTQAAAGNGVVFVTSDLSELLEVADRVVVLQEGRSVATLDGPSLNAEAVLQACYQSERTVPGERHATL